MAVGTCDCNSWHLAGLVLGWFDVGWVWPQVSFESGGLALGGFGFGWVWHCVGLLLGGFGIGRIWCWVGLVSIWVGLLK